MRAHRQSTGQATSPQRDLPMGGVLALICGVPALLAFPVVAAPALAAPAAASLEATPQWQVRWDALSSDDRCPTPRDGFCDASLARRRLCLGPLELRYSYSH
ncbi:MAG: hypothetical protein ACO1SX_05155 [Actinomycetota bacterium]